MPTENVALRYDECLDTVRIRWKLPAEMTQYEAQNLVLLFKARYFNGRRDYKVSFDYLGVKIFGLHPTTTLEIKLAPSDSGNFWLTEGLSMTPIFLDLKDKYGTREILLYVHGQT